MPHKFRIGTLVQYNPGDLAPAARGAYKVIRQLPIERDQLLLYRIKSAAETFERTAEENQLSKAD